MHRHNDMFCFAPSLSRLLHACAKMLNIRVPWTLIGVSWYCECSFWRKWTVQRTATFDAQSVMLFATLFRKIENIYLNIQRFDYVTFRFSFLCFSYFSNSRGLPISVTVDVLNVTNDIYIFSYIERFFLHTRKLRAIQISSLKSHDLVRFFKRNNS